MNMNHISHRIVLVGGSGFLGSALADHFVGAGWAVSNLTRQPGTSRAGVHQIHWDGSNPGPWCKELDGATAVINLAGKSVNCRYTVRNRREILRSRVDATQAVGRAIAPCSNPPAVWVNAHNATV